MKTLILITLALTLGACGHATTTMDRDLALKLADKPQVQVIQSAPPIVNVTVNNNGAPAQVPAISEEPMQAQYVLPEQKNCVDSPIYSYSGKLIKYVKQCFGSH